MRPIIEAVVDRGSFFEIGKAWGRSLITGLARLDGWPVAVVAGDPYFYGGAWTADASLKMTRFAELAETFHVPVVHLVDIPGFLIGTPGRAGGDHPHGARALASVFQTTVPWCSIIVRKCFGVAGAAHMNTARLRYRYAWPSADWGSLPVEGGIEAAYKAELEAAEDREATLRDIEERLERARSPFRTAETYWVEENHRSTRHPDAAVRVREPGRAAPRARPDPFHLPAVGPRPAPPRAARALPHQAGGRGAGMRRTRRIERAGNRNQNGTFRKSIKWTNNPWRSWRSGSPTLSTATTSTG